MQLGGNAKAASFFKSHNCLTKDVQEKYNSRAASLYREKLSQEAVKAMRLHGDKVGRMSAQSLLGYVVALMSIFCSFTSILVSALPMVNVTIQRRLTFSLAALTLMGRKPCRPRSPPSPPPASRPLHS